MAKDDAEDLVKKIRRRNLKQQEEEEEEKRKKAREPEQITGEDDENLENDDDDDEERNRDDNNDNEDLEEDYDDDEEYDEDGDDDEDEEDKDDKNDRDNRDDKDDEKKDKNKKNDGNDDNVNDEETTNKNDNQEKEDNAVEDKNNDTSSENTDNNPKTQEETSDKGQLDRRQDKPDSKADSGNFQNAQIKEPSSGKGSQGVQQTGTKAVSQTGNQAAHQAGTKVGTQAGSQAAQQAGRQAAGKAATQAAGKAATQAAGKAAATKVAGVGLGVVGVYAAIIILIIVCVIGLISFFVTLPGAVVGKIGEAILEAKTGFIEFFSGEADELAVGKKEVVEVAEYLSQMGYDLEGFGFLASKDDESPVEVAEIVTAKVDGNWFASLENWWNSDDEDNSKALAYTDFSTKSIEERKEDDDSAEYHELYLSEEVEKDGSGDIIEGENSIKKKILMSLDQDDVVKYAKSKYIAMYLTADNSQFLLRNDHANFGEKLLSIINLKNPKAGTGMLNFPPSGSYNIDDYIANLDSTYIKAASLENEPNILACILTNGKAYIFNKFFPSLKASLNRQEKILRIENKDDGAFKNTVYDYSLDGWATQYGVPLQLSLALHLSSLAPDFAYQVAELGSADTTVNFGLLETKENSVVMQYDIDFDNDGIKEKYSLDICYEDKTCKDSSGNTKQVKNGYFRLIDQDGNPKTYNGNSYDDFVYIENGDIYCIDDEGWFLPHAIPKEIADPIKEQAELDDYEQIVELFEDANSIATNNFTRYIPFILGVKGHWYQDISFEGCYEWDTDDSSKIREYEYTAIDSDSDVMKKASNNDMLSIKEITKGKLKQIADGKEIGTAGERIKNLIDNFEYYKYDGVQKSKEKEKINFKETAVDAIAMLEQIGGYDAQHIIRLFKELMASYDIYFEESEGTTMKKELFSKIIKDYSGQLLTNGEDCVYKAEIPPAQQGFDNGLIVQSPCNGKITYRTNDAVCILIDAPGEKYDKYTILISGFEVKSDIFSDTKINELDVLGETLKQDLKLTLRDENGSIVKNKYVITTADADGNIPAKSPCKGKIISISGDTVTILIDEPGEEFDQYTLIVSGLEIDKNITEGQTINEGDTLGKSTKDKNKVILKDKTGAEVENTYELEVINESDSLETLDAQTAAIYNLTEEELDVLYAVVSAEAYANTESAMGVVSCIMNRADSDRFTGDTPYEVVIQPNQFEGYLEGTGNYKKFLNGEAPEVIKKCVKNGLSGIRTHKYYYFRTDTQAYREEYPNGESIGGNWYFEY